MTISQSLPQRPGSFTHRDEEATKMELQKNGKWLASTMTTMMTRPRDEKLLKSDGRQVDILEFQRRLLLDFEQRIRLVMGYKEGRMDNFQDEIHLDNRDDGTSRCHDDEMMEYEPTEDNSSHYSIQINKWGDDFLGPRDGMNVDFELDVDKDGDFDITENRFLCAAENILTPQCYLSPLRSESPVLQLQAKRGSMVNDGSVYPTAKMRQQDFSTADSTTSSIKSSISQIQHATTIGGSSSILNFYSMSSTSTRAAQSDGASSTSYLSKNTTATSVELNACDNNEDSREKRMESLAPASAPRNWLAEDLDDLMQSATTSSKPPSPLNQRHEYVFQQLLHTRSDQSSQGHTSGNDSVDRENKDPIPTNKVNKPFHGDDIDVLTPTATTSSKPPSRKEWGFRKALTVNTGSHQSSPTQPTFSETLDFEHTNTIPLSLAPNNVVNKSSPTDVEVLTLSASGTSIHPSPTPQVRQARFQKAPLHARSHQNSRVQPTGSDILDFERTDSSTLVMASDTKAEKSFHMDLDHRIPSATSNAKPSSPSPQGRQSRFQKALFTRSYQTNSTNSPDNDIVDSEQNDPIPFELAATNKQADKSFHVPPTTRRFRLSKASRRVKAPSASPKSQSPIHQGEFWSLKTSRGNTCVFSKILKNRQVGRFVQHNGAVVAARLVLCLIRMSSRGWKRLTYEYGLPTVYCSPLEKLSIWALQWLRWMIRDTFEGAVPMVKESVSEELEFFYDDSASAMVHPLFKAFVWTAFVETNLANYPYIFAHDVGGTFNLEDEDDDLALEMEALPQLEDDLRRELADVKMDAVGFGAGKQSVLVARKKRIGGNDNLSIDSDTKDAIQCSTQSEKSKIADGMGTRTSAMKLTIRHFLESKSESNVRAVDPTRVTAVERAIESQQPGENPSAKASSTTLTIQHFRGSNRVSEIISVGPPVVEPVQRAPKSEEQVGKQSVETPSMKLTIHHFLESNHPSEMISAGPTTVEPIEHLPESEKQGAKQSVEVPIIVDEADPVHVSASIWRTGKDDSEHSLKEATTFGVFACGQNLSCRSVLCQSSLNADEDLPSPVHITRSPVLQSENRIMDSIPVNGSTRSSDSRNNLMVLRSEDDCESKWKKKKLSPVRKQKKPGYPKNLELFSDADPLNISDLSGTSSNDWSMEPMLPLSPQEVGPTLPQEREGDVMRSKTDIVAPNCSERAATFVEGAFDGIFKGALAILNPEEHAFAVIHQVHSPVDVFQFDENVRFHVSSSVELEQGHVIEVLEDTEIPHAISALTITGRGELGVLASKNLMDTMTQCTASSSTSESISDSNGMPDQADLHALLFSDSESTDSGDSGPFELFELELDYSHEDEEEVEFLTWNKPGDIGRIKDRMSDLGPSLHPRIKQTSDARFPARSTRVPSPPTTGIERSLKTTPQDSKVGLRRVGVSSLTKIPSTPLPRDDPALVLFSSSSEESVKTLEEMPIDSENVVVWQRNSDLKDTIDENVPITTPREFTPGCERNGNANINELSHATRGNEGGARHQAMKVATPPMKKDGEDDWATLPQRKTLQRRPRLASMELAEEEWAPPLHTTRPRPSPRPRRMVNGRERRNLEASEDWDMGLDIQAMDAWDLRFPVPSHGATSTRAFREAIPAPPSFVAPWLPSKPSMTLRETDESKGILRAVPPAQSSAWSNGQQYRRNVPDVSVQTRDLWRPMQLFSKAFQEPFVQRRSAKDENNV